MTNSFDAEQGLAGGAVVNVNVKSGTNEFHGSVFEYHTNSKLRARNFFYLSDRLQKNILNQYGFTLGGPVRKNKLFFFGDFEGTKRRQNASGLVTLPTSAVRAGDFSASGTNIYDPQTGSPDGTGRQIFPGNGIPLDRIDQAALKLVGLVPQQNLTGDANNFFYSDGLRFNRDTGDVKVNYNPTDRIQVFGRTASWTSSFSIRRFWAGPAATRPAAGSRATVRGASRDVTLGGTVIFTPHLLMDAHAGYTRRSDAQTALDFGKNYGLDVLGIPGTNGADVRESGFPRFNISGFAGYGNLSTSSPSFHIDSQYVYNVNFGYTHGAHSLRWGVDVDRQHMNHWQPEVGGYGPRGGFNFTGGLTALRGGTAPNRFNASADFLLGLPTDFGKSREEFGVMSTRR